MKAQPKRIRERGFSLTEVMVATAAMIIVFVGILLLYDRANNVFKTANESADMQQNLRVAYDRVLADVRMAGFDYKRGGPLMPGQTAAPWAPVRAYAAGTIVTPITANGHTYRAMNGGTSGNAQPSWPTTTGGQVTETGATPPIVWAENGAAVYEQPDEQVEYAGATAITIRGNFDYSANQTGDTDHGREPALENSSPHFPLITTGNDEIVTYALVSNRAPAGTAPNNQSISMYIDINSGGTPTRTAHPGGNAERQVTISGVDLTNNNPPYTLYRFTFDAGGLVQRIPLADNIRSLNFYYFADAGGAVPLRDAAGALAPSVGGGGQYNPAVANSWNAPERLVRARIRGIRVRLVGMSAVSDPNFRDPTAAAAVENGMQTATTSVGQPVFGADTVAQTYRRVAADTMVAPRNLGLTGLPQSFLQPPPAPTITSVCYGYCAITVLNWNPNSTNPNASYIVKWDVDAAGSFSNAYDAGTSNTFALDLTGQDVSQNFYFQVVATNQGGDTPSAVVGPYSAVNATKPNVATSVVATGNGTVPPLPGKVRLTWTAPITNATGSITCSSGSATVSNYLREIEGFRIYRSTNSNVPTNPSTLQVDENTSGTDAPTTDGYGNFSWEDTDVSCGQTYYYRIETVEYCAAAANQNSTNNTALSVSDVYPSTATAGIRGSSGTSGTPATPVNLKTAPPAPAPAPTGMTQSVCDSAANTCNVSIGWSKVTQDTSTNTISIGEYEVQRAQFWRATGLSTGAPVATFNVPAPADPSVNTVVHTDVGVPEHDATTGLLFSYKYRVRALQTTPCPSGTYSAWVDFPPPCTFTGSIVVQTGASAGDGLTPGSAWVMAGGDGLEVVAPSGTTLVSTTMQVRDPSGTAVGPLQSDTTTPFTFNWGNQTPSTIYSVTFTMTNNASPACTEQLVRYVQQEPLPACALTTFAESNTILVNTATKYQMRLTLINEGTENMTLTALKFNWTPPADIQWGSIKFPSANGATMTGPGTAAGAVDFDLDPLPGQLAASDVTVNANNGTRQILINMAKTQGSGNPPEPPPSTISSICVQYKIPSVPALASTTFSCQIKPDLAAGNPTTCQ